MKKNVRKLAAALLLLILPLAFWENRGEAFEKMTEQTDDTSAQKACGDVRVWEFPRGTPPERLPLPEQIWVKTAKEGYSRVSVVWRCTPNYYGDVPGEYLFTAIAGNLTGKTCISCPSRILIRICE